MDQIGGRSTFTFTETLSSFILHHFQVRAFKVKFSPFLSFPFIDDQTNFPRLFKPYSNGFSDEWAIE
jgi:hypothetical protein